MKLPEFITYCTLKDVVTLHHELFIGSSQRRGDFGVWTIDMEARGFYVHIRYERDNSKFSIMQTSVYDNKNEDKGYVHGIALSQIQENLFGHR